MSRIISRNSIRIMIFYRKSEEIYFVSDSESCTADAGVEQVEEEKFQADNSDEFAEGTSLNFVDVLKSQIT